MESGRQSGALNSGQLPVAESGCPVDSLISMITGPWTGYIVWVLLQHDSLRFSELKKEVHGISARVLTDRLRRLETAGLIRREQQLKIPPHVSYELTARGRELEEIMQPLEALARRWFAEDQRPRQGADNSEVDHATVPRLHRI